MIRHWCTWLVLIAGVCVFSPASGQIFSAPNSCTWYRENTSHYTYTPAPIIIPNNAQPGDFLGGWQTSDPSLGSVWMQYPFYACASMVAVRDNPTGEMDNLYVQAIRPAEVYVAPEWPTADGQTVWTTNDLSAIGVGFLIRWRVTTQHNDLAGAWRSPTASWTVDIPPPSAGLPFYRFTSELWSPTCWLNAPGEDKFSSIADYRAEMIQHWDCPTQLKEAYFYYGAQVQVRYVLTKQTGFIYDELDLKSGFFTTQFITLRSRPNTHQINDAIVSQDITYLLPPTGTCTTPSVQEATVRFGTIFADSFPDHLHGIAAQQNFYLTLSQCPKVPISYYFHANGVRWVDSSSGIVGVQDSIPGVADPVAGNPRGYGIQILHNGGSDAQHGGIVYVHPNETNAPVVSYTRSPTGAGTTTLPNGVIHTIPLAARLVRTAHPAQQQIQPGTFNASLIFVIRYP